MNPKNDRLVEILQEMARERDPRCDPRWEALAQGKLSDEDAAELRDAAQRSEAMGIAYEVFRPMDSAADERILARVLAGAERPDKRAEPAQRRTGRHRRILVVTVVATSLAAAAAVGIVLNRPETPIRPEVLGGPIIVAASEAFPAYNLELAGGDKRQMGPSAPDAGVHLGHPESRLMLALRPEFEVQGAVVMRAVLLSGHQVHPWNPSVKIHPTGVITLDGNKKELFAGIPPGEWLLLVGIGRPDVFPESPERLAELLRSAAPHPGKNFQILRGRVVLSDPETGN